MMFLAKAASKTTKKTKAKPADDPTTTSSKCKSGSRSTSYIHPDNVVSKLVGAPDTPANLHATAAPIAGMRPRKELAIAAARRVRPDAAQAPAPPRALDEATGGYPNYVCRLV